MAKIPFNVINTTKNLIEHQPDTISFPHRSYLGMSSIASECVRKLWYGFRWASMDVTSVRMQRIFERGDIEEARIIRDLKKNGVEVFRREGYQKIELTGAIGEKQEEFIGAYGHSKGHADGRCLNVPEAPKTEHILEIKTMGSKYFKILVDKGVQEANPVYYGQTNRYMLASGTNRTLFIATNKDTEERYYERIRIDKQYAEELEERECEIVMSPVPFGEKFSPSWYKCKSCNHYDVCHRGAAPLKTCRSCEYADLAMDGKWVCTNPRNLIEAQEEVEIDLEKQKAACSFYKRAF